MAALDEVDMRRRRRFLKSQVDMNTIADRYQSLRIVIFITLAQVQSLAPQNHN